MADPLFEEGQFFFVVPFSPESEFRLRADLRYVTIFLTLIP